MYTFLHLYISAKIPELNLVDTTRISNRTNSPRLALLYRQNFGRVWVPKWSIVCSLISIQSILNKHFSQTTLQKYKWRAPTDAPYGLYIQHTGFIPHQPVSCPHQMDCYSIQHNTWSTNTQYINSGHYSSIFISRLGPHRVMLKAR